MNSFDTVEKIIETAEKSSVRLGACVSFNGQKFYGYREHEEFDTACGIKAFIFLEYVNQIFSGKFSGKELLTYTEENFSTGAGAIKYLPFGSEITMENAAELMTTKSDHIAANLLIDALGTDAINETIQRLGFAKTKLHRKFLIPKLKNIGSSSPQDYTKFFSLLNEERLLCAEASQYMKKMLLKQKYKDILTEKILNQPDGKFFIDVMSKSGFADGKIYNEFTDSYIVDGGIILTTKGAYEISLFADVKYNSPFSLEQVKSFLQEISANFFNIFMTDEGAAHLCST